MNLLSRTDRSFLGEWWWTVDRTMLLAVMILMAFGVVLVATASPPVAEHLNLNSFHFLKRHVIILVPALLIMIGVSMLDARWIRRLCSLIFVGTLALMVWVLIGGMEIKGAQRWVHLPGFSLQPGEFIKPAFAVMAAWMMSLQNKENLENGGKGFPGHLITAGLYLVTITLLLLQPDLGMTVVVTAIWGAQIFIAGFPFRYMIAFLMAGLVGLVLAYSSFSHVQSRIDRFLDPSSGDNYQVEKSLEAFKSGGVFGTGPGQGEVKLHLPDAHADFIFAVAGEEMGLIFVLIILALFLYVIMAGLNRVMDSADMFAVLTVGGLLSMFGFQALVHMGSSLNILPTKGMTLPFMSYGGSSLLSTALSMGIVLGLTRRQVRASIAQSGYFRNGGRPAKPQ